MPIRRSFVSALAIVACLGLSGCSMWQQARFKESRALSVAHEPGTGIDVATQNGAINLSIGDADDVEIDAHIKAITQQRLDLTKIVASRLDDGTLYLRVDWPGDGPKGSEGCSFDIRVPEAVGVTLVSSNGALLIDGTKGEASLRTSNGQIYVENHDGNVRARTSNGWIELVGVRGSVDADTSNGRVRIELADGSNGPIQVETSNGAVQVSVGAGFTGELSARTSNGSLDVLGFDREEIIEKDRRSCTIKSLVGRGAPASEQVAPSRITSSNGSITITRRDG